MLGVSHAEAWMELSTTISCLTIIPQVVRWHVLLHHAVKNKPEVGLEDAQSPAHAPPPPPPAPFNPVKILSAAMYCSSANLASLVIEIKYYLLVLGDI